MLTPTLLAAFAATAAATNFSSYFANWAKYHLAPYSYDASDLAPLASLNGLVELRIRDTQVSGLSAILFASGTLERLDIRRIALADLDILLKFTQLSSLWMSLPVGMTLDEVGQIVSGHPNRQSLRVSVE